MGYVENNLLKGEEVVFTTKNHPIIFLWPVVSFVLGLYFIFTMPGDSGSIGGLFVMVGIIWGVAAAIRYYTSEFAITNKRVIIKVGLIKRITLEMNREKIESIGVNQSILGRILTYGTLIVSGTGSSKQPFPEIAAPLEFKKIIQEG